MKIKQETTHKFFTIVKGKEVEIEIDGFKKLKHGYMAVEKQGLFAIYDRLGVALTKHIYDDVHPFKNGIAIVEKGEKCTYIDKNMKRITKKWFYDCQNFKDGVAIVSNDYGKYGLIRDDGVLLVDTIYDKISKFKNGFAMVKRFRYVDDQPELRYNYIDYDGALLSEIWFREIEEFDRGYGIVHIDWDNQNMIDSSGKLKFAEHYKKIYKHGGDGDFLAIVENKDDLTTCLNTNCEEMFEPKLCIFDGGYIELGGDFYSIMGGPWEKKGLMDVNGKYVIECEWKTIWLNSERDTLTLYDSKNNSYDINIENIKNKSFKMEKMRSNNS